MPKRAKAIPVVAPATPSYYTGAPKDKSSPDRLAHAILPNVDPIDAYRAESRWDCRRRMLWLITSRSPAFMRGISNMTMALGSRDVLITPTVANPSATDLMQMQNAVAAINESVSQAGFFASLAGNFVDGMMRSQTGAFALPTRDSMGRVLRFEFINPLLPRPHFGFDPSTGYILMTPRQAGDWAQGIWYYTASIPAPYVNDDYYQSVYGSYGSGRWLEGEPPAERALSDIAGDATLADVLRRVVNGTDLSQIITVANADLQKITEWRDEVQSFIERRARGEVIPLNEMPRRLMLAKPSSLASEDIRVTVHNLRLLPEDFDIAEMLNRYAVAIAQDLGISPRWTAMERAQERSGNATQAALINSDEPGMAAVESAFTALLSRMLLPGVSAQITLRSASAPENYARLSADEIAVKNAKGMIDAGVGQEVARAYLLRNNVLIPSEVGQTAFTLAADAGYFTRAGARAATARLAVVDHEIIRLSSKELRPDEEFERCSREATARYNDWIERELPTTIINGVLDVRELADDVDSITKRVAEEVVQCARRYAQQRDEAVLAYLAHLRYGLYNRWGSPAIQTSRYPLPKPGENLFGALRALRIQIANGQADVNTLRRVASGFAYDVLRYFASASALAYIVAGRRHDGPVQWVLDELAKHCDECPRYAGTYTSYTAMLAKTGGKIPRDIRLQCAGGCRCKLVTLSG